jgi:hypothetical protein
VEALIAAGRRDQLARGLRAARGATKRMLTFVAVMALALPSGS